MQKFLTVLGASFIPYSCLFMDGMTAAAAMFFTTFALCIVTAANEKKDNLIDKVRLAWAIHIIGAMILVFFHNVIK